LRISERWRRRSAKQQQRKRSVSVKCEKLKSVIEERWKSKRDELQTNDDGVNITSDKEAERREAAAAAREEARRHEREAENRRREKEQAEAAACEKAKREEEEREAAEERWRRRREAEGAALRQK
jgi:colicin import membrane protein